MCGGGGGGGGDNGAAQAAAAENARRQAIQKGTADIDRIFGGYKRGINPFGGDPSETQTYYLEDGTPVTVRGSTVLNPAYQQQQSQQAGLTDSDRERARWDRAFAESLNRGGGGGGAAVPQYTSRREIFSNGNRIANYGEKPLYAAFESVPGFDDNYYKGIEDKYVEYAMPKLEEDYQDAVSRMLFALERRGLSASSAAGNERKRLETQYNRNRQNVINAGKSQAQRVRGDVENTRSQLITQLAATEDPAAARTGALVAAQRLSEPPPFDPLSTFVFDVSEGLRTTPSTSQRLNIPSLLPGSSGTRRSNSITYQE